MRTVLLRVIITDGVTDRMLLEDLDTRHRTALLGAQILTDPKVLVVGNPFDGLTIIGPYSGAEESIEADEAQHSDDWWSVDLEQPLLVQHAKPTGSARR